MRSRPDLCPPNSKAPETVADRRVLEVRKANYGPTGGIVPLLFNRGRFILDPEPLKESTRPGRTAKPDTRLSMAIMDYFNEKAPSGQVVRFGSVFESLQASGLFERDDDEYETVRKRLQRTLSDLVESELLESNGVPRGCYRIASMPGNGT